MRLLPPRMLLNGRHSRSGHRYKPTLATLEDRTLLSITIDIDYTYDTADFFNTQAKRDLMQLAAETLADDLGDNLSAIVPSGGDTWQASFPSPATGSTQTINNLVVPANTIIVYVGGRTLAGGEEAGYGSTGGFNATGDQNWVNTVAARGQAGALAATPTDFGPWGGSIAFDNSTTNWYFGTAAAGLQANQTDFLTVAEHELAHVLGFGTSVAWQTDVTSRGFVGPNAEAAYGGAPVPVSPDGGHWAEGTMSDGHPATMDPVLIDGERNLFTTLDYAGLEDIGWQFEAPVVQFSATSATVSAGAGSATVTVNRTGGGAAPFTVQYSTGDGTAKAGTDYTQTSGTLSFGDGVNSLTFTIPLLNNPSAPGNETFVVDLSSPTAGAVVGTISGSTVTIVPSSSVVPPGASARAASDTGVSDSDGTTQDNGSSQAPLTFTVNGVVPANAYVCLLDVTNPTSIQLAGPIQAINGSVTFTLAGTPLNDGPHQIAANAALTPTSLPSSASPSTLLTIQSSTTLTATNPAPNAYVTALPNGAVTITFSHPLAGLNSSGVMAALTSGGAALSDKDPYAVFLLQRGPSLAFTATSGTDGGNLPLHANTIYTINPNGTSTITITPEEPLSSDVYGISVQLSAFTDLAGNTPTDPSGLNGFHTFLLQPPPTTTAPLKVVGVTTFNGYATVNNNLIYQPDTLAIQFNKPLWQGAVHFKAGPNNTVVASNNVQLLANVNGMYTVQPSVATYGPATDSIYLTPTGTLSPGTTYLIRVDGFVSDDQGFSGPDTNAGGTLGTPYYNTFSIINQPVAATAALLKVADDQNGNPETLPGNGLPWGLPLGYASVTFTNSVSLTTGFTRSSAMLDPRTTGSDDNTLLADIPLNAQLAFNPNTNQLIIVPTVLPANGTYILALNNMESSPTNPLLNPSGTVAGVTGPPFYASFGLNVVSAEAISAAAVATGPVIAAIAARVPTAAPAPVVLGTPPTGPASTFRAKHPKRPAQAVSVSKPPARLVRRDGRAPVGASSLPAGPLGL